MKIPWRTLWQGVKAWALPWLLGKAQEKFPESWGRNPRRGPGAVLGQKPKTNPGSGDPQEPPDDGYEF